MRRDLAARKRARHNALTEYRELDSDIAALEAKLEGKKRHRAIVSRVARSKYFRDGTPKNNPKHREVARRYAWLAYKAGKSLPRPLAGRTGRNKLITLIRMRELERLIDFRYGGSLFDTSDGRQLLEIVGHHIVHLGPDAARHIVAWARVFAPWMPEREAASIAERIIARPLKFRADTLGRRLNLFSLERSDLGITTIGAFDVPKAERELRRKEQRAAADRRRRRQKGAIPRLQYEARSKAQTRPWEKLSMSRSTWYRHGMPMPSKSDL